MQSDTDSCSSSAVVHACYCVAVRCLDAAKSRSRVRVIPGKRNLISTALLEYSKDQRGDRCTYAWISKILSKQPVVLPLYVIEVAYCGVICPSAVDTSKLIN